MKRFLICVFIAISSASYAESKPKVIKMALGENFSCALFENQKIKCWGQGNAGQLGNGRASNIGDAPEELGSALTYIDLGIDFHPVSITAGRTHVCALSELGKVKCWGENAGGQLGLGDEKRRGNQPGQMGDNLSYVDLGGVVSEVISQESHSCAVFVDGRVKCWGLNDYGALGLGDNVSRGKLPSQMGASLPFIDLGENVLAKKAFVGRFHTCIWTTNNKVKCFGYGQYGVTGSESKDNIGETQMSMGENLRFVDTGGEIRDFCTTSLHNCAVDTSNTTRCFGYDDSVGRLGSGINQSWGYQSGSMGGHIRTTKLSDGFQTQALFCGWRASCGLLENGGLKCWGSNLRGGIGLGPRSAIGFDRKEMGEMLPYVNLGFHVEVQAVYFGGEHTCVLTKSGQAKCFGNNQYGQLGLGDARDRGRNLSEMGDNLPYAHIQ